MNEKFSALHAGRTVMSLTLFGRGRVWSSNPSKVMVEEKVLDLAPTNCELTAHGCLTPGIKTHFECPISPESHDRTANSQRSRPLGLAKKNDWVVGIAVPAPQDWQEQASGEMSVQSVIQGTV